MHTQGHAHAHTELDKHDQALGWCGCCCWCFHVACCRLYHFLKRSVLNEMWDRLRREGSTWWSLHCSEVEGHIWRSLRIRSLSSHAAVMIQYGFKCSSWRKRGHRCTEVKRTILLKRAPHKAEGFVSKWKAYVSSGTSVLYVCLMVRVSVFSLWSDTK